MPGRPGGRRVAEPVSLLDLAPTLAELAGTKTGTSLDGTGFDGTGFDGAGFDGAGFDGAGPDAAPCDGVSLLPWLSDGRPWRRPGPVVAEYLAEGVTNPAVMLRTARHKLVVCDGDPDQLYDLARDPLEQANLAGSPHQAAPGQATPGQAAPGQVALDETAPGQAASEHRSLRAYLAAHWDLARLRDRVLASQRDRRLVGQALNQGTYTSWDYQPTVNDALRYVRSRSDLYDLQKNARLDSADT
jgi:choline-sulfatase